ncbi:MAG: bifunctional phosphoribosylaminoimidazolecarboxamide formyltransferase/IMP cyclohydrolase [Thermodesulfobacteriota bacterium]
MKPIKRALVSVFNKEGVVEFCQELDRLGVTLLASEGTGAALAAAGIQADTLSSLTGFSELLSGRVKTLHPAVFAGILARRERQEDIDQLSQMGIAPVDLVLVNLYPFGERPTEDPMDLVDIGGSALIRAAAKNHKDVAVVVDPDDYQPVLSELKQKRGITSETRFRLAGKAFRHAALYDSRIADYFAAGLGEKELFPEWFAPSFKRMASLRYGENPHQRAALYLASSQASQGLGAASQHQGKELSYNNILDLDAALATVAEFDLPAAVIIKHTNPCGVAVSEKSIVQAYIKAKKCDPVSAFGGVIALNRLVDKVCADEISSTFMEAVVAPGYDPQALGVFKKKKNLRVLELAAKQQPDASLVLRGIRGGLLVQQRDEIDVEEKGLKVVTKRAPTDEEMQALRFAWKVCKHVKSNAIVYALKNRVVGIGAGQMSRVDAALLGVMKAKEGTRGAVAASDAFFPFRDGVDTIAQSGVTAIIQPGGSIRDQQVIDAANEHGLAMVFTGIRHFRH